ncbi:putative T7SS-secreted protein [Nocardioides aquiterrae]|uniref:Putative T7SS secretion signal domain-containing protein n=1 Tax=Nocardioides aquiterrae TaxID=203799 RepID=A0ABP4F0F2_9ACTN
MYGDTTTIRALARRLRERGDEIRDLAAGLGASARDVAWDGLAADAMRTHVEARVRALYRAACLHDDAADALDRHAREVDHVKDLLHDLEEAAQGAADGVVDKLKELL